MIAKSNARLKLDPRRSYLHSEIVLNGTLFYVDKMIMLGSYISIWRNVFEIE